MPARSEHPQAIIGGTGFSEFASDFQIILTDYGDVRVGHLELGGKEVFFLSRHQQLEAPHLVNYRANMQALKLLDVNTIFAVSACGRLAQDVLPGHLVGVDDIDWDDAGSRPSTFVEPGLLLHASTNELFSPGLRTILAESWEEVEPEVAQLYDGTQLAVGYHDGGTYFNINGPAFTPPHREARLRRQTEDSKVIGMTLFPETHLAREMAMAYAAIGMCVDHSNFPGAPPVSHAEGVMVAVQKTAQAAYKLINRATKNTPNDFYDVVAHGAFKNSLFPGQVDFDRLKGNGRTNLAFILDNALKSQ
ncbi:MTAP family purine nucleoside phosphorylase [Candidatus Roizmanbacteria bacterium]|nr:MTAP family purine nucleoside phosphorylase [Candidatus Roizmanbacteria bacterium]